MQRNFDLLEFGFRDELVRIKLLGALLVEFGQFQSGLRVGQVRHGAGESAFVGGRINLRQFIALAHFRVKVHLQFSNDTGDLAADGHGANRVECAIGGHHLGDFAPGDRRSLEFQRRIFRTFDVGNPANGNAPEDDQDHQPPAKMRLLCAGHSYEVFYL